jgi:hypothetical protein
LLTKDRMIYLGDIAPGLDDLDMIRRIDTDWDKDEEIPEEWLAIYRYDRVIRDDQVTGGPFGAAIYDIDLCRPPAVLSYELIPVDYDYLAQDSIRFTGDPKKDDVIVENIIEKPQEFGPECFSQGKGKDYPEVLIFGRSSGVRTDLNIFRKRGEELSCIVRQQWSESNNGLAFPCPLEYENIGSFRGNYRVERDGSSVIVLDRAPFERSQLAIRRVYQPHPQTDTYYLPGEEKVLAPPVKVSIVFGPGAPQDTQDVYYPEKTVLAFFLQLAGDPDAAMDNVCAPKGSRPRYDPMQFGLTQRLNRLDQITVCEIRYQPDIEGERNHEPQVVQVRVVENGIDCNSSSLLECSVNAEVDPNALPYGCQWCLSGCVSVEN